MKFSVYLKRSEGYGWLGFEFGRILLQKDRKGYALSSPEGRWAKAQYMEIQLF